MNCTDVWDAVSYFIYGAALGYLWHPVWAIIKKIWHEAKVTRDEWRKSENKDS